MKNLGEQFLQSYDVHKKPQAIKATERKESQTGENLVNDSDERITAYMERMERVFLNPNEETRDKNINIMKPHLHKAFVIKEENFPDSYFEYQKKLQKEERGMGDVEFSPEQKKEEIERNQKVQEESLDAWIDYLTADNPYPPAIKLFVVQGILKLGKLDTKKYKFARRVDATVAPFPEIDREALAKVMGALQDAHYNEEEISDSSAKLKEMVANNANFGKMYAGAIQELDKSVEGEKNWEEIEGEWKTFKKGSEPSIMQDTLANKRSNLCIGEGLAHAKSYLNNGDMCIYYSKDNRGNYTIPRIAISVQNDSVWEVRGTYNKNEDIDPYIGDILDEKLAILPQGEAYQKKSSDMKRVTEVDEKTKTGGELSKEDLRFLYEMDSKIQGFGYDEDPRIAEIKERRNIKEDLAALTGYSVDEISITKEEALSGGIKYHYGYLELHKLFAEGLNLPDSIGGYFNLDGLQSAKGLNLPDSIGGDFYFSDLQSAKGLNLPDSIGGELNLNGLISAEGLNLPETLNGSLKLNGLQSAKGLNLPDSIGGDLGLNGLQSAEGLNLPDSVSGTIWLSGLQSAEKEELRRKYPNLDIGQCIFNL